MQNIKCYHVKNEVKTVHMILHGLNAPSGLSLRRILFDAKNLGEESESELLKEQTNHFIINTKKLYFTIWKWKVNLLTGCGL